MYVSRLAESLYSCSVSWVLVGEGADGEGVGGAIKIKQSGWYVNCRTQRRGQERTTPLGYRTEVIILFVMKNKTLLEFNIRADGLPSRIIIGWSGGSVVNRQ